MIAGHAAVAAAHNSSARDFAGSGKDSMASIAATRPRLCTEIRLSQISRVFMHIPHTNEERIAWSERLILSRVLAANSPKAAIMTDSYNGEQSESWINGASTYGREHLHSVRN